MVDAFEREFAEKVGIPFAAAVCSGTSAHILTKPKDKGPNLWRETI